MTSICLHISWFHFCFQFNRIPFCVWTIFLLSIQQLMINSVDSLCWLLLIEQWWIQLCIRMFSLWGICQILGHMVHLILGGCSLRIFWLISRMAALVYNPTNSEWRSPFPISSAFVVTCFLDISHSVWGKIYSHSWDLYFSYW